MGSRALLAAAVASLALAPAAEAQVRPFHDTFSAAYRSPGGAVATGTPVRLRLRVTGGRPKSVTLRLEVGDPVRETSRIVNLRMTRRGSVWSRTYRTPSKPSVVSYAFRVGHTVWYGDDDSSTDFRKGGTGKTTRFRGDSFRITVHERSFTTPAWLQGAVVYQIFADRFRNGDRSNDYCRLECPTFYGNVTATLHPTWNEEVEDARATGMFNRDFFGGDLEGVTEKLDYLKSLGAEAIWLTPIFKARSNHRYDTDDYQEIDPGLGGHEAFTQLVNAARSRGIRLILDGVFNHTSSDSRYFDRYNRYPEILGACESPSSPFRDWYEIDGTGVPCRTYSGFAALDTLPTLSDSNADVRNFIYRGSSSIVRNWTSRGADGWRLDVAQELSHPWWRDFRSTVKSYAPEAPLIGEVTAGPVDATAYLLGDELDGVMNYRFRQAAIGFARTSSYLDANGEIRPLRPSELAHALQAVLEDYPRQAAAVSFNLVDSHDTNRVLFALTEGGDLEAAKHRQRLVALLQFTSFGAPMIYYGDEAGINAPGKSGFGDPYNRAPYPWPDASGDVNTYGPPDAEMIDYYTKLASLRRSLVPLRTGSTTMLFTNATVLAFARVAAPHAPPIVVLNKGSQPATVAVPVRGLYPNGATLEIGLGDGQALVAGGRVSVITVAPRSGVVLIGTS